MYIYEQADFVYKPVKHGSVLSLFCKLLDCVKQNKCYASMFSPANCLRYRTFFCDKRYNGWCMSDALAYYPVAQGFIRCVASCSRTTDVHPIQSDSFLCVNLLTNGRVHITSAIKKQFNYHTFCFCFYENFRLDLYFTKWEDIKQLEKYCKIFSMEYENI